MVVTILMMAAGWFFLQHPVVPVAIGLLPLAIIFAFRYTFWLVILFIVFSFFRIHEAIPALYSLKIPLLLSLGSLGSLAWHFAISRKIKPHWHRPLTWLCIFWALSIIGVLFSTEPQLAIQYIKNIYWKIMVMTLAIAWLITDTRQLRNVSLVVVAAGMLVACVALSNYINNIGLVEGSRVTIGRDIGSMLGDPNDLSLVLMFPLAFSISLLLTKEQPCLLRFLAIIAIVLSFSAVFATQSRGGLLGSMAVIGIFAMKYVRSKILLILGGLALAIVLYAVAGISGRASGGAAEAGIDASAMGRLYAWEAAFNMALSNPFTGVGLDNFFANYYFYSTHWDGLPHAVHSTWFGILAETGFLGLFVFIGLLVSLFRLMRQVLREMDNRPQYYPVNLRTAANAVYAGLIGTIVSGTFLTQGFNWPIYILSGLAIAVVHITHIYSQNENPASTNSNSTVSI